MNKSDYDKYYKKGGTYVIPVELFNELFDELEELNKKIKQYENPEDMTLMFMWCNEKAKDEIKRLNNIINELEKWLNEKICLNKNDKDYINGMTFVGVNLQMYQLFLDKLQELKGSDK